jgi:hypothetical protein
MNDRKLLVEVQTFRADPSMLRESLEKPNAPFRVKGILQRATIKNQNGRIYPKEILLREAQKYMDTFIRERRALGELDHPESSVVNLKNVSHNVTEMHWEGDDLVGTVEVLTTPSGNILRELFRNGINVGISSRALGSLNKISESTAMVGEDLELIAFDFVSNPSTAGAFMFMDQNASLREGVQKVQNPVTNKWESVHKIVRDILSEIN